MSAGRRPDGSRLDVDLAAVVDAVVQTVILGGLVVGHEGLRRRCDGHLHRIASTVPEVLDDPEARPALRRRCGRQSGRLASWGITYSFEVQPIARGRKAARVMTLTHARPFCLSETNRWVRSIGGCCSVSVPAAKAPIGAGGEAAERHLWRPGDGAVVAMSGAVNAEALMEARGVKPHAAVAAIRARGARFAAGDRAPDGRKLALVVEGGALRAVCSAGGVVALEHLGLTEVFNHVYGTSAGAMNASYFVTGQARLGIRIYYEDMNRRAVVKPWRFWKILDLDRLFEQTILGAKRLRLDAILAARSKLHIATLEAKTGTGRIFDAQLLSGEAELLSVLRAATAAPFLYNQPVAPWQAVAASTPGWSTPFPSPTR